MTVNEYIETIIKNTPNLDEDTPQKPQKLIYLAYYIGLEKGVKEASDRYNDVLAEQIKRAHECRYHDMAMKIQGDIHYVYNPNYSSETTTTFGDDKTSFPLI